MRNLFFIIFLFQLNFAAAQSDSAGVSDSLKIMTDSVLVSDSVKTFSLSIFSNTENAQIYIDTALIGKTPLVNYMLKEGSYKIKLLNIEPESEWQNDNIITELVFTKDTILNLNFKYFYYFKSEPYNAQLLNNDSLLGFTPLRTYSERKIKGSVIFRKENYMDFVFDMNDYNFKTGADVKLKSLLNSKNIIDETVYKNRGTQFKTKRNLIAVTALGLASAAGAFAAYTFKNTANKEYAEYLLTGNTQKLDSSNKNDKYFVISLVLMQAAVGGLIYFLFFD